MFSDVVATFEVLAEPTRRRILDLLLEGPRLVGELTDELGLSQPGTSKHLRVLREAGLVRVRPEAQRRWYELHPQPLREIDAWLAPYRRMWSDSFDALERHLDAMPDDVETNDADEPTHAEPRTRPDRGTATADEPTHAEPRTRPDRGTAAAGETDRGAGPRRGDGTGKTSRAGRAAGRHKRKDRP